MKKPSAFRSIQLLGLGFLLGCLPGLRSPAGAQTLPPIPPLDPEAMQWPRFFATNGYEFAVYQPQISAWPGNQIQGRFATAVRPAGTSNETYGVVFFQARTEIDKVNRLVTLEDFAITKMNFPTQPGLQKIYQTIIQSELPAAAKTIPLDHLEAVFVLSGEIAKAKIQPVQNTPPKIIYTTQPSLLILVDGAPILKPLTGSYLRVVNTRAIILESTNLVSQGYYLYAAANWYSAPSIEGPWTVNLAPPGDIHFALEEALATKQVDPITPKSPLPAPLILYVSTGPAELLQSTGAANLLSIAGTDLLYVANSDQAIFYYLDDGNYYVLISGRWFNSASLYGPWAFVPPDKLPADFKRIPPDAMKANVLASVPGTPMAQEAVIANSIPQTATIDRATAKLAVDYFGSPGFLPIAGTSLFYATNTAVPVIRVNAKTYYACQVGVWFVGPGVYGPWTVAASVPAAIYTIPVTCPIHCVTYAYVYGATPQYIYVGYTPGYMGTVVTAGGVVVYGTAYVAYPPTYGFGWGMAVGATAGFAFGYAAGHCSSCACEPYWGCYHSVYASGYSYTHVNCNSANFYSSWGTAVHATGSYGYNAYTGTTATGSRGAAYNPYTGTAAAGKSGSAYNPYTGASAAAESGAAANAKTGNYAAGKQASGYNPSTGTYGAASKGVSGNAYNGTSSSYNHGVVGNTQTGNKAAWNNGNLYTDKDGNVNKYSSSGAQSSWDKSSSSSAAAHESYGQSTGADRFSSFSRAGGGGWGGRR